MAIRRPPTVIPLRSSEVEQLQHELQLAQQQQQQGRESRASAMDTSEGDKRLVQHEEEERKRKEEQGREERIGLA
jgi:hypothetical protein